MVNVVLYRSSIISSVLHTIGYVIFKPNNQLLLTIVTMGLFTSLWNHKVTCNIAKYTDRAMMILGFISNLYIISTIENNINQLISVVLLVVSTCFYLYSKIKKIVGAHILSHLFLTINHVILMSCF